MKNIFVAVCACMLAGCVGFSGVADSTPQRNQDTKEKNDSKSIKLLFVGDLHLGSSAAEEEQRVSEEIIKRAADADLVVMGGDMTDAGRPEQYASFMRLYSPIKDKCVLVRGNHDMGNYMQTLQSWLPCGVETHFHPGQYPVWVWTTAWFEMLNANTKCLFEPQRLPEPYNRLAQAPVIVVYDGLGPYYFFEKAGFRFIVLDASTHRLGEQQQVWLKQTIESSQLPIIILLHPHIMPSGSAEDACCMLWDSAPLLQQFVHNEKVIGIFAAHIHFNRAWDWHGKKIVTTGSRGVSRFIKLENGKITDIEPLDNQKIDGVVNHLCKGNPEVMPLDLHYWCPDGVLAKNTFWSFSKGLWDDAVKPPIHWGWYNPNGPGGLIWSVPPELLPDKEIWFSVNFRSTTPWKLILEENGTEKTVCQGDPGENLIAAGSFGRGPNRPFRRVILKQESPACGHASCYMSLNDSPTPKFIPYP